VGTRGRRRGRGVYKGAWEDGGTTAVSGGRGRKDLFYYITFYFLRFLSWPQTESFVNSRVVEYTPSIKRKHGHIDIGQKSAMAGDNSIWLYNPSFALSVLGVILYAFPTTVQFYQTVVRYRAWYFLPVLVGGMLEVGGYIARAYSASHQDQIVSSPGSPTIPIMHARIHTYSHKHAFHLSQNQMMKDSS
jgi:hypothetical protein